MWQGPRGPLPWELSHWSVAGGWLDAQGTQGKEEGSEEVCGGGDI